MNLHWMDVGVLLIYLGGMAGMGFYFARRNTNTEEYFVGGRSFAGWAVGLSLVGTSISSVTFLAYPADAFKTAWLRYLPNFMLPVGIAVAAYVFLPLFRRRKNATSAYEFLEDRYGPSIRLYGAVVYILAQLARISIILYLLSLVIQEITGLDPVYSILIGGVFVAVYTIIGGIDAVIWTDVIQTITLVFGGVVCLGMIVYQLPGGIGTIVAEAGAAGKFAFAEQIDGQLVPIPWGLSLTRKTVVMILTMGLLNWLTEYCANQGVVQRYFAARSEKEARKAMWVCALASLPIWAFFMFLGTSLFVFFRHFPAPEADAMLTGARTAEGILPFFVTRHLPLPGLTGLILAGALAAAMSSLDSSINSIATVTITDIYRRHWARDRHDRHYLRVAWAVATATAVCMIAGAILLTRTPAQTIQDTVTILTSVFGGGLLAIYLYGFFMRGADARAVGVGIVLTITFTAWAIAGARGVLTGPWACPVDPYYTTILANAIMFITISLSARLLPKRSAVG